MINREVHAASRRCVHVVNIEPVFIRNALKLRLGLPVHPLCLVPLAALKFLMHGDCAHPTEDDPRKHKGKE